MRLVLLFPFTILYSIICRIRNLLYDLGLIRSNSYKLPVISIGNLSTGGTGKSPHTEYLISLLSAQHKVCTLSRGYGRKSSGFRIANAQDTFAELGDEPLQYYRKFPDITVAVDEKRARGILEILKSRPETSLVILDDAYQHRSVKPGFNILISTWQDPFTRDYILPSGNLREPRKSANRADAIIISKVDKEVSAQHKELLKADIKRYSDAPVFCSRIIYTDLRSLSDREKIVGSQELSKMHVLLLSGIANADPLLKHIKTISKSVTELKYGDHKHYGKSEIAELHQIFNNIDDTNKLIVTTEKDAMRLLHPAILSDIRSLPIYFQEIKIEIENKTQFDKMIVDYVKKASGNR
ncbi:MAG: tetraacyldisaccharide 4'-kinase [Bacteroidia bacterium]|nr:tetraacyldisaccharide 4'-kinase [Bacteroidia bacterium]